MRPKQVPELVIESGVHIAFYRFVRITDLDDARHRLMGLTAALQGTILLAKEGVNGMLAGAEDAIDQFIDQASADPIVGALFDQMVYKRTRFERAPFSRMLIKVKDEIVPLGIDGLDMPERVDDVAATDVPPAQWRELIQRDDVVVLDNRNSFEYEVGRFRGAVDPGVVNFRDFRDYVEANADTWRAEGKEVAMYCTGGIRCEKSSPWMQDLGLKVHQLQGGILNYFQELDDAEADFEGECFVFDNRITLDTKLRDVGRERSEIDG